MTYPQKKAELFKALKDAGWTMSDPLLKTPHATSPNKLARLWFHPRSIYLSTGLTVTQAKESRSIDSDFKKWSADGFVKWANHFAEAEEATTAEPMDEDEGQARHLRTQEAK